MRRVFGIAVTILLVVTVSACGSAGTTTSSTAAATSGAAINSTGVATAEGVSATIGATTDATAGATTGATTGTMATSGATTEATSGMMATSGETTEATSDTMATSGTTTGTSATTGATSGTMATSGTTTGTSATSGTPTASNDLVSAIAANPDLATLATAIQASGIESTLQGVGPFTIFAPSDEAFAALPQSTLTALLANPTQLASILSYHVTQGSLKAADIANVTSVNTVEGKPITVSANGGTVTLNGQAKVTTTDIVTSNGVIHIIDKVLIPPDVTLPTS